MRLEDEEQILVMIRLDIQDPRVWGCNSMYLPMPDNKVP
jgi:hypothetical protein